MLPPLLPSSLLSSDDLVMEQAAAESALPDVVDVIHCEYVFSNALGYFLVPELKYEDLPARVRPAGFPFVLGSQTPVLTSYHLLYISKENSIALSDYVYLGGLGGPSFISLGQVDYDAKRSLNGYLLKRVNVYFDEESL